MNLKQLYDVILARENVPCKDVRTGKRIAVVTALDILDIMKVNRVGQGRSSLDEEMGYVAVAKICPGQLSMSLRSDGGVHLNEPRQVEHPTDVYGTDMLCPRDELGVLYPCLKAHWIELDSTTAIRRITKSEMRAIQAAVCE